MSVADPGRVPLVPMKPLPLPPHSQPSEFHPLYQPQGLIYAPILMQFCACSIPEWRLKRMVSCMQLALIKPVLIMCGRNKSICSFQVVHAYDVKVVNCR